MPAMGMTKALYAGLTQLYEQLQQTDALINRCMQQQCTATNQITMQTNKSNDAYCSHPYNLSNIVNNVATDATATATTSVPDTLL